MRLSQTPLMDYLNAYAQSGPARYHMPGHKGHMLPQPLAPLAAWDITEIEGSDNLHRPEGVIAQSQALLSHAVGAAHSFYLVGGSTAGIQAMVMCCLREGDKLLVERNCHKSAVSALALSGAQPIYLWTPTDPHNDLPGCLTPQQVSEAVANHPDAKALLMTSPNYYGCAADLPAISQIVHNAGMMLLVDEAHGAHLPYAPVGMGFPQGAAGYADMWVQSAHKTLPAPTQCAMLHVKNPQNVPRLQRMLGLLQTSSPSYLFMAGLEAARVWMQQYGEQGLVDCKRGMDEIRGRFFDKQGIRVMDREMCGRAGVVAMDATRLVVDVSGIGLTGYQAEAFLRTQHNVWPEMSDMRHVVLLGAAVDTPQMVQRLQQALVELNQHRGDAAYVPPQQLPQPAQVMALRSVMQGDVQTVALEQAAGRVMACAVGLYPPGIPMLCPGEQAQAMHIQALIKAADMGAQLFGVQDGCVDVVQD